MNAKIDYGRWLCENCGCRFDRDKAGSKPIRFCSQLCYHKWAKANKAYKGTFQPDRDPWNRGLKGIHLSPSSEFKRGCESNRKLPVGSERTRIDKSGKPRVFVKVAEPNRWELRAILVWKKASGKKVPSGCVIHHCDRDSLNDAIDNLECLTRAEHLQEHRHEYHKKKAA